MKWSLLSMGMLMGGCDHWEMGVFLLRLHSYLRSLVVYRSSCIVNGVEGFVIVH